MVAARGRVSRTCVTTRAAALGRAGGPRARPRRDCCDHRRPGRAARRRVQAPHEADCPRLGRAQSGHGPRTAARSDHPRRALRGDAPRLHARVDETPRRREWCMTVDTTPSRASERDQLGARASELLARDGWSRERLLDHQQDELRELIRYAVARAPYYREALAAEAAEGDVSLDELPTLPKQLLMEQFNRVVTDPRLRLEDVESHLVGSTPAALLLGDYHVFATSGTSGLRGVFVQTRAEFEFWVAACLRALTRFGIGRGTRVVGIGAPGPLHITKKLFVALGGPSEGVPELTVITPLPQLVEALNDRQPEAILTHASVAGLLAELQLQGRLGIEPRCVVVS